MSTHDFLLEIGCEEIPARFLPKARAALAEAARTACLSWRVEPTTIEALGTPRRIAIIIHGLPAAQADYDETVTGPPWDRAFADDGKPTGAAQGFAQKQGIDPTALQRIETPRGFFAGFVRTVSGRPVRDLLAEAVPGWIGSLPFGKNMRWEPSVARFARPIRWIVAVFGTGPLWPAGAAPTIAGVVPGVTSMGHRFRGGEFSIADAASWKASLVDQGVVVDPAERRRMIVEGGNAAAAAEGLTVAWDEALLDEVLDLVELPGPMIGSFKPEFLELPDCVLEAPMKAHQRYFPLRKPDGRLADRFLFVANRPDDPEGFVRAGNERVLAARLADARFFWQQDRAKSLDEHAATLARIVWQEGLGTLDDLRGRVGRLAGHVLPLVDARADAAVVRRAGELYLADLGTQMVFEFAEVQGEIGAIYAELGGEPAPVVTAIREAHRPKGADDDLAATPAGVALALAHRIDLVVGNLIAGHEVKGNQDPYGMRRAAIGVFRMLEAGGLDLDLAALSARAAEAFAAQGAKLPADLADRTAAFWSTRLEGYLASAGEHAAALRAVLAAAGPRPAEARRRLAALATLLADTARAEALLDTYKRLRNIARDAAPVDLDGRFENPDEADFADTARSVRHDVRGSLATGDAVGALARLEVLVQAAAALFEKVRIQDDDPAVTTRRQGLVRAAREVFDDFAVFGILVGGDKV
jgi:glycyl-tRNA synthetase beta chain